MITQATPIEFFLSQGQRYLTEFRLFQHNPPIPDIHLSPRETPRRRAHTTDSRAMPSRNAVLANLPINSLENLGFVPRGEAGGYIPERSAARAAGCCSTSNGGGLFAGSRASDIPRLLADRQR